MEKDFRIRKLRTKGQSRSSGTIIKFILLFLVGVLVIHPDVIGNFIKNYYEQYNLLVHGRINYCTESVGIHDIISLIRPQILHQDEVLNGVEMVFRDHIQFTPIAIIGTTGVGKTLFSNLLMNYFPWKENVHHFSWATFADEREKNFVVNKLLRRLSDCGHNLIVIDDLTPKEVAYVGSINKKAEKISFSKKSLILIYIFNIPSYLEQAENAYRGVSEQLENLEGIQTVPFRSFDQSHLSACIKHEAKLLNVSLNAGNILEIQNTIEATHSGCKGVYAKVSGFSEHV